MRKNSRFVLDLLHAQKAPFLNLTVQSLRFFAIRTYVPLSQNNSLDCFVRQSANPLLANLKERYRASLYAGQHRDSLSHTKVGCGKISKFCQILDFSASDYCKYSFFYLISNVGFCAAFDLFLNSNCNNFVTIINNS